MKRVDETRRVVIIPFTHAAQVPYWDSSIYTMFGKDTGR